MLYDVSAFVAFGNRFTYDFKLHKLGYPSVEVSGELSSRRDAGVIDVCFSVGRLLQDSLSQETRIEGNRIIGLITKEERRLFGSLGLKGGSLRDHRRVNLERQEKIGVMTQFCFNVLVDTALFAMQTADK